MPCDSRRSSRSVWSRANSRKSCTAISPATIPARTIPARKRSGSRTLRDLNIAPTCCSGGCGVLLSVARGRDLVPDAPDGDDGRGVAELATELADVDVHRPRVAGEGVAPHTLEQLVAREHEAAVVEQLPEEVELLRRELDLLVGDVHLAPAGVDVEVAVLDRLALAVAPLRRRTAQHRPDARDELPRVERLRQVVVGADLETDDLVDVLVARGQHQDRHVRVLPDP